MLCTQCLHEKDKFVRGLCRACYQKKRLDENPHLRERSREFWREWRERNKEKATQLVRDWEKKNRKKFVNWRRKYMNKYYHTKIKTKKSNPTH